MSGEGTKPQESKDRENKPEHGGTSQTGSKPGQGGQPNPGQGQGGSQQNQGGSHQQQGGTQHEQGSGKKSEEKEGSNKP